MLESHSEIVNISEEGSFPLRAVFKSENVDGNSRGDIFPLSFDDFRIGRD